MAETLTATISAAVNWNYTNTLTGSINTTNSNGFSYSKSLTNGTGAASTADLVYASQGTISASGNTEWDLAGTLTTFAGTTITMARIKVMYVEVTSDTTATSGNFGNGTSPVSTWISSATATVKIYNDGVFLMCDGGATAYAVTAGSADDLKLLNNDGANTLTYQVCFIGASGP